jgi:hypothetical protein
VELVEPVNDDARTVGAGIVEVETDLGVSTRARGELYYNWLLGGEAYCLGDTDFVLSVLEVEAGYAGRNKSTTIKDS